MNRITQSWDGNIFSPAFAKLPVIRRLLVIIAIPLTGVLVIVCGLLYVPAFIVTGGSMTAVDKVMEFPTVWQRFIGGV